jgi:hypothetical protein
MLRYRVYVAIVIFGLASSMNAEAQTAVVTRLAAQAARAVSKSVSSRFTVSKMSGAAGQALQKAREWVGFKGNSVLDLDLKSPKGHCAFPKNGEQEKAIYTELSKAFNAETTVHQYSVLCKDLSLFWQGQNPHRWAMYTFSKPLPEVATRAGLAVELTKTTPELKLSEIASRSQKMMANDELSGIVESTPDAVYVGSLAVDESADKKGSKLAHIAGITIIANRVVGLNLYAEYSGRKTFDELLLDAKDVVARSIDSSEKSGGKPTK